MKVYFNRKVLSGFFLALHILTFLGIFLPRNSYDSMTTSQLASHTAKVFYSIEKLPSANLNEDRTTQYSINAKPPFYIYRFTDSDWNYNYYFLNS
jgi:hypothetical protein